MLTPTQIIEQMLKQVADFDAAHTPGTLDNSILRVEANSIFRILRTIEETSGQRFLVTASGSYLDLIGQGMSKPRLSGESDDEYRARLIFNPSFWNDCTVDGIKQMIKSYYGIDMDNDEYDETRLVELYKQAAVFFNKEKKTDSDWEDYEGWVNPSSDFGAEWLGEATSPGAFEVHLNAFQAGEERFIKKRQVKQRLMEIRAAGIVVFLYFHIKHGVDVIPPLVDAGTETELAQKEIIPIPENDEQFELIINNNEVVGIVANTIDELSGKLSRRIVHDRQKNRCNNGYSDIIKDNTNPYILAELDWGEGALRPEPFRFRQARLRNDCWHFFYGIKYEERDVTIPATISIPIKAMINDSSETVGIIESKYQDTVYIVMEISGNKGNRTVDLLTADKHETYYFINSILDLQLAMANSEIGELSLQGTNFSVSINQAFRRQFKREPVVHTYYTRPNPMLDEYHHRRCDDLHGLDFYSVLGYMDFWWRVSTVQDGVIGVPSVPYKLTIAQTKEGVSDFWWKVTDISGKEISDPSIVQQLRVIGKHKFLSNNQIALSSVNKWVSMTQTHDLFKMCESDSQLVLMENYNPQTKFQWSRSDIVSVRVSQTPERLVIAKLNIGNIDINDPYLPWVDPLIQAGITGTKIKIRYWEDSWKTHLQKQIERIMKCGFDGILLTNMDSWQNWGNDATYEQKMLKLVTSLKHFVGVIKNKADFKILAHRQDAWHDIQAYTASIDGIVSDDLFVATDQLDTVKINNLNLLRTQNKNIFVIISDSATSSQQSLFCQQMPLFGFVPSIGKI